MNDLLNTPGGLLRGRGYAGMIVDQNFYTSISKINNGSTAIGFGVPVASNSDGVGVKVVSADADHIIGFSIRYAMRPYDPTTGTVSFGVNETVPVAKTGRMYVLAAENAVEGDAVISISATNTVGSTTGGAAGTGRVAIAGAKWAEPVAAGAIGIIEFNLLGA